MVEWTLWGMPEMAVADTLPVIFLPGWGCSGRMLSLCAPAGPWWSMAGQIDPGTLLADLEELLDRQGWPRVILVGWSMGARLALEFASLHPDRIEALTLLAIRRSWPESEIAAIRRELLVDPDVFLRGFYRKCFLGRKEAWRQFVNRYQGLELHEADLSALEAGLFLLQTPLAQVLEQLRQSGFPAARIWLLHGENDIIAPCSERLLLDGARQVILQNEGHALFLAPSVRGLTFLSPSVAGGLSQG